MSGLSLVSERTCAFAGLVGESKAMQAVYDQIRRFGDSIAPVYIHGETGTGKERVARAIHAQSRRSRGPFVPVNAAAIGDEIFDSEFFGHVRGAFTGATATRDGYVAAAECGTLFIDEVADLSPRAQVKLLRFLQEKQYRRVGENQERRADVRVVSASNVDLETRVASGAFRRDLLFRLKFLQLKVPPLRARTGDVLTLARYFLAQAAEAEGKRAPRLSEEAGRALEAYPWPGNVRELQGKMHTALVLAVDGLVRTEDLLAPAEDDAPPLSLAEALRTFEREYVSRVLAECRGHRMKTAERLGITRQGLSQMLKRLGMDGTAA